MAGRYARMLRSIAQEACIEYQNGNKDALKQILRRHNLAVIQTMFLEDFAHLQKFKQLLIVKNRMLPSMISSPPALTDPEELKSIQEIAIKLHKILNEDVDSLLNQIKSLGSYQYVLEKMGWRTQGTEDEIKSTLAEAKGEEDEGDKKPDEESKTEQAEENKQTEQDTEQDVSAENENKPDEVEELKDVGVI